MTRAAATEIEQNADRAWWEFWKGKATHSLPDLGLKKLAIGRGITELPNGDRQVEIHFSLFGYYAGVDYSLGIRFSGHGRLNQHLKKSKELMIGKLLKNGMGRVLEIRLYLSRTEVIWSNNLHCPCLRQPCCFNELNNT